MDTCHGFNLNVDPPADHPNLHLKQSLNPETSNDLVDMVSRIDTDNAKIIKSLGELFDKYEEMHRHLIHLINPQNSVDDDTGHVNGKKRKAAAPEELSNEEDNGHVSAAHSISGNSSDEICCRISRMINYKPKISTNFIRIDKSDTSLAVKDGYQWRKYGQKVTRDNPSPRAYYKCSFAPLCSVKKKVQRSVEDTTVAVVTYQGEHNHKKPPSADFSQLSTRNMTEDDVSEARLHIVDQMVSALTKKPSFTSDLASAIYSHVLHDKSYSS